MPLPQGYILYDSICRTFLKITEMKNRLEVEGCGQQEGSRCGYEGQCEGACGDRLSIAQLYQSQCPGCDVPVLQDVSI